MNKILAVFICSLVSSSVIATPAEDAKKKGRTGDQRVFVTTSTRDLNAPYGQPVKVAGNHILTFKNIFATDMTIQYFYSLKVNEQHFDRSDVITLKPYESKTIELESAIYNVVFNRGKYPIVACTATVDTGSVCDHKQLTVY